MADYILPQQMLPAPELIAAMTGTSVFIGTLLQPPVKLILDNQSTSSAVILFSFDGVNFIQWKTFTAGEVLVLDDDIYSFPRGMQIWGNGAATGNFSASYTYINYPGIT